MRRLLNLLQDLDHHCDCNSVIHRFGNQPVPQIGERPLKNSHIANPDWTVLLTLCANINKHFAQRRHFIRVAEFLGPDYTQRPIQETHPSTGYVAWEYTAQVAEPHKSIIVDMCGDHTDLIDMPGKHNLLPSPACRNLLGRFFPGDQVAQGVHSDFISKRLNFRTDNLTDLGFITRWAGGTDQFFD